MKEEKGETNHIVNTWVSITDYVETSNANTNTPTYMSITMYIYNNYNLVIYNYNTIVCLSNSPAIKTLTCAHCVMQ